RSTYIDEHIFFHLSMKFPYVPFLFLSIKITPLGVNRLFFHFLKLLSDLFPKIVQIRHFTVWKYPGNHCPAPHN
ncbi:hypothetical protein M5W78_17220, partial [Paenibacillus larvae]|uniref:hypothetical protein n=1 Tax=Paenibacillus larvae TaxID=1464 RepID=UPI0022812550